MTIEQIKKIRDDAGTEKAMIITCDNEHIFYDNIKDSCPLIWDDENERLISFEKNMSSNQSQAAKPGRVVFTAYEHIQFIEVIATVPEVIEILNKFKDKMTEEQYNYCIKFYAGASSIHMCKPGTYSHEELKAQEEAKEATE